MLFTKNVPVVAVLAGIIFTRSAARFIMCQISMLGVLPSDVYYQYSLGFYNVGVTWDAQVLSHTSYDGIALVHIFIQSRVSHTVIVIFHYTGFSHVFFPQDSPMTLRKMLTIFISVASMGVESWKPQFRVLILPVTHWGWLMALQSALLIIWTVYIYCILQCSTMYLLYWLLYMT